MCLVVKSERNVCAIERASRVVSRIGMGEEDELVITSRRSLVRNRLKDDRFWRCRCSESERKKRCEDESHDE